MWTDDPYEDDKYFQREWNPSRRDLFSLSERIRKLNAGPMLVGRKVYAAWKKLLEQS